MMGSAVVVAALAAVRPASAVPAWGRAYKLDCNACHVILAQGSGAQLEKMNPKGHAFEHPGGDFGDMKCNECHNGGPQ